MWLFSPRLDILGLYLPVWCTWCLCFVMPHPIMNASLPLWAWVLFVLGADVSHVWSTIFRTYLDKSEFQQHKKILLLAPVIAFVGLFPITFFGELIFWRFMAYLALYHFIKQQYGFLMLYRAKSRSFYAKKITDKFIIYFATLYPVVVWHFSDGLTFDWFVKGDFVTLHQYVDRAFFKNEVVPWGNKIYWLILLLWFVEEVWTSNSQNKTIACGKILWVFTTAMNWFLGIVWLNSDFAFSTTNVVAHGVPYMLLIFFYVERKKQIVHGNATSVGNSARMQVLIHILLMCLLLVLLTFGESYFWDMFLNRDKAMFFESFFSYPTDMLRDSLWRSLALTILSIPQVSHYIIDGFIWKNNHHNPYLNSVFFGK